MMNTTSRYGRTISILFLLLAAGFVGYSAILFFMSGSKTQHAEMHWASLQITGYELRIEVSGAMVPFIYDVTVRDQHIIACTRRAGLTPATETAPTAEDCVAHQASVPHPITVAQLFQHARTLTKKQDSGWCPPSHQDIEIRFDHQYGYPNYIEANCKNTYDASYQIRVTAFEPSP